MINYDIDFVINKSALIKICPDINIKWLLCCQDTLMVLLKDNKRYSLSTNPLYDSMCALKNSLKKALKNQLQLHPSVTRDIGYLFNEDLQDKPGLVYDYYSPESKDKSWVGEGHLVWLCDLATWLYNDVDGNIILHITPVFPGPWGDDDFDEEAHERAYAQWIVEKYKPLWTITLSPATARLWLRLAEDIYRKLGY